MTIKNDTFTASSSLLEDLPRQRPYNFAPGPAALPTAVLEQARAEMLDWHGSGTSVMEMSHRGKEFSEIYEQTLEDLRSLLKVPPHFKILFLQGGGLGENAAVAMNLSQGMAADFVVTGTWSEKSVKEARKYCDAHEAASSRTLEGFFWGIPDERVWHIRPEARYLHICSNETIHGIEYSELPDLQALTGKDLPLSVDASSHILSRPVDWSKVGILFAGAQKNIGIAGLTLVFVREDLLGRAMNICPLIWNYEIQSQNDSMINTPPAYAIYIAGLFFQWIKQQGGVMCMQNRALERSQLLYDCIDSSDGFYVNRVDQRYRSRMNVPFFLRDERLNDAFIAGAQNENMINIKGHKSVGGMRASIYNSMPVEGVQALVHYMKNFAQQHG